MLRRDSKELRENLTSIYSRKPPIQSTHQVILSIRVYYFLCLRVVEDNFFPRFPREQRTKDSNSTLSSGWCIKSAKGLTKCQAQQTTMRLCTCPVHKHSPKGTFIIILYIILLQLSKKTQIKTQSYVYQISELVIPLKHAYKIDIM